MSMQKAIRGYIANDDGAVTVDWVVLTAAIVGLAAIAFLELSGGVSSVGSKTGNVLSSIVVADPLPN